MSGRRGDARALADLDRRYTARHPYPEEDPVLLPGCALPVDLVVAHGQVWPAVGVGPNARAVLLRRRLPRPGGDDPTSLSAGDDARQLRAGPAQLDPGRRVAVVAGKNARDHPPNGVSRVRF